MPPLLGWIRSPRGHQVVSWAAVILWAGIIFHLSSLPLISLPFRTRLLAKLAHVVEYAILTLLLIRALMAQNMSSRRAVLITLLVALAYAVSDEYHQSFVPGRHPSSLDVLIDTLGVGTVAIATLAKRQRNPSA